MRSTNKIAGWFLAVLILALFISNWLVVRDERNALRFKLEEYGKTLSQTLGVFCAQPLLARNYSELNDLLARVGKDKEDVLFIEVRRQNEVVAAYDAHQLELGDRIVFSSAILLTHNTQKEKLAEVVLGLSDWRNRQILNNRLREITLHSGLIFLLIFIVVEVLIRRIILKRMTGLKLHAQQVCKGAISGLFPLGIIKYEGWDEFGELAAAIEEIANNIMRSKQRMDSQLDEILCLTEKALSVESDAKEIKPMSQITQHVVLPAYFDDFKLSEPAALPVNKPEIMQPGKASFKLRTCLEPIIEQFSNAAFEKGLGFNFHVAYDVPNILPGNSMRLKQILTHLLRNAFKFTQKGKISIYIKLESESTDRIILHFMVSDTGSGIIEEKQKSIFSPRLVDDDQMVQDYENGKLSLAICAQKIQSMGGKIWLTSKTGQGSIFHFTTVWGKKAAVNPLRTVLPAFIPQPNIPNPIPYGVKSKLHILLATETIFLQEVIKTILSSKGYSVTTVNDGNEVLNTLEQESFNLIIVDLYLPAIDGFNLTSLIRKKERDTGDHTPIIAILNATAFQENTNRCLQTGMDGCIAKPVKANELFALLAKIYPSVVKDTEKPIQEKSQVRKTVWQPIVNH